MISQIAYSHPFGFALPLVAYLGWLTFLSLLSTATVGFLNFRGRTTISFKWHPRLAATTITLAVIHAVFALSAYLNF